MATAAAFILEDYGEPGDGLDVIEAADSSAETEDRVPASWRRDDQEQPRRRRRDSLVAEAVARVISEGVTAPPESSRLFEARRASAPRRKRSSAPLTGR